MTRGTFGELGRYDAIGDRLLRPLVLLEFLVVFIAGLTLFFAPDFVFREWAWVTPPFNSRFLGAVYLTTSVPLAIALLVRRQSLFRIVVWAVLTFTTTLLIVSLLYTGSFEYDRIPTWIWWSLYVVFPVVNAWYARKLGTLPPWGATMSHPLWRTLFGGLAVLALVYAVALLVSPGAATEFWPWPIDDFHGRLYSGVFLSEAVVLWLLLRGATTIERQAVAGIQITLSTLSIVGLMVNDANLNRVNWVTPGTWIWIAALVVIALSGAGLLLEAQRHPKASVPHRYGTADKIGAGPDVLRAD